MNLRTFAILAAFAVPALASADKTPAGSPPTNNSPTSGAHAQAQPSTPSDQQNPGTGNQSNAPGTPGSDGKSAKLGDAEVRIAAHLHHVNQMEISLGQQAQKSGTARIRDYARTLVTDHQSADKDLMAFAKAHKLNTIPADKPMTDADRQDDKDMTTTMAHLKTLKGADFDKEFLSMMVSGHDKELAKIDTAISSVSDPDLKSLLQTVKPMLQRHADQARDLQKSPQASADPNKPVDHLPSSTSH